MKAALIVPLTVGLLGPAAAQDKSFDSALAALAQDKQDDRAKRIMERIEKELRESEARLREDIRNIIRSEIEKGFPAKPPPPEKKRAYLGITVDDLTDAERKALGIPGGIKIAEVRGPAAQAGLKAGDILLDLGGVALSEEKIAEVLEKHKPGDVLEATVLRNQQREKFKITLAERKD